MILLTSDLVDLRPYSKSSSSAHENGSHTVLQAAMRLLSGLVIIINFPTIKTNIIIMLCVKVTSFIKAGVGVPCATICYKNNNYIAMVN